METPDDTRQTLGDYCKGLELPYTANATIPPDEYCIIRVDGRAFHTFTKPYKGGKEKAFSKEITDAMMAAIESLINEFSPVIVYSQSDEITVVIDPAKVPFGRKCHKLNSIAASVATAAFNMYLSRNDLFHTPKPATFDARAYGASREDVLKVLIWRQRDAIKNSISAVARTVFSHKMLEGKKSDEKIAMLAEKGVDWESFSHKWTYGMAAFRGTKEFTIDLEWLREQGTPEKVIEQLAGEGGMAVRHCTLYPDITRFDRMTNLDEVIFSHAEPLYLPPDKEGVIERFSKELKNEDV